jgi:replicative DNA helicase
MTVQPRQIRANGRAPNGEANGHDYAAPLRAAPHNIEAEQALLGAILVNNTAHDRVSDFLELPHFFDPLHQRIFETASRLIASGKQATPITLKTFFENLEPIDATLTVPQYLGKLAADAATIINAREYARTIYDLATRRQLIVIGEDLVNAAYDSPIDFPPREQIAEAETRLFALAQEGENERPTYTVHEAILQAITAADEAQRVGRVLKGLSTGIPTLDEKLGGLAPGRLVCLGGRPSMGKTALATSIGTNVARAGHRAYFFSLEMTSQELGDRITADAVGMSAFDLSRGVGVAERMRELLEEAQRWAEVPLIIDQSSALTIVQLRNRARRAHRKAALALIIVDYLQLLRGITYRGKNRVEEIGEISGGLKALAKELNVPVLVLSQLNRAAEGRENRRPQLSDLRASGDIEQDADAVVFVYRDAYYLEREPPDPNDVAATDAWRAKLEAAKRQAEITVAKNRHGPIGTVEVVVDERTMRFGVPPQRGGRG